MEWALVLPVKSLVTAKSRLSGGGGVERAALALALAHDTVQAATRAAGVRLVVVVTRDPAVSEALGALGARVVAEPEGADLNDAVRAGAAEVSARHPDLGVAALVADLPALRSEELARALDQAGRYAQAFVADRDGTGTTVVTASPGSALVVAFGPGSAARHRAGGAVPLEGVFPSLRCDVDTREDLAAAGALGLGPATSALLVGPGP